MSASVSRQEISHMTCGVLHDQVRAIMPWPTARSLPSGVALGGECPPRCADRARQRRADGSQNVTGYPDLLRQ